MRAPGLPKKTSISPFPAMGLPWKRRSSGFGSKRSTWLGPPYMKRKITDLARGVKCGDRCASGFFAARADPPCGAAWSSPSRSSRSAAARPAKPAPARNRSSRRVIARSCRIGKRRSVDIEELARVEERVTQVAQRRIPVLRPRRGRVLRGAGAVARCLSVEELEGPRLLRGRRRARERELPGLPDLSLRASPGKLRHTGREV